MGDSKKSNLKSPGKKPATPTKQDAKTKSPVKNKNSTPSKIDDKSNAKNKKTPSKESPVDKKTPVKTESKTSTKASDVKSPATKSSMDKKNPFSIANKKSPGKDSNVDNKTPLKKSSPQKGSTRTNEASASKKVKGGGGLPVSRVRLIMKTARYAEAMSPDAVQLTVIATELFIKYLMQGVHADAIVNKKKVLDYNGLAAYVNNEEEEHLEFLRVLIPHKITVAKYKKLMAENSKSDGLDFLGSESEESGSEESSEEEEEMNDDDDDDEDEDEEDSEIEEIPTPQKSKTTPQKSAAKKGGKVETVDLCESSSEEDVKVVVL
ncbi:hypothetical protein WDU94_015231 [Cyamophila willieti]